MANPELSLTIKRELGQLWLKTRSDPTALGLILFNLFAAGIAVLHPPIIPSLLLIYWCECIIVGLFTILKFFHIHLRLGPEADTHPKTAFVLRTIGRILCSAFFALHYGGLVFVTGGIIELLGAWELKSAGKSGFHLFAYLKGLHVPIAILTVSHGYDYVRNFVGKKEYVGRLIDNQMLRPYPRMLLMFFVVFSGAALISVFHLPALMFVIFVPLKIAADLYGHFRDQTI